MAVEMQSALISSLSGKFEKLKFFSSVMSNTMSTPSTPSTPLSGSPPLETYTIQPIKIKDTEIVLDHLRKFFFRDEPLNISIKLLEPDGKCVALEEFSVKSIKEGFSVMAVSASGKVVGVCLNGGTKRDEVPEDEGPCPNPKFAKILDLLEKVDKEADIFGRFPDIKSYMNIKILSVDSTWRGRGIGQQLMDKTRDIARDHGFDLMRGDATSKYSAKAMARLGFESVYVIKYSDYKVDGKVVFEPEPPHTELAVYVQRIKKKGNL